ncbi:MAG: hypothetical protein PHR16_04520 [Methylovulum sp.]|nr:hypothetical protein [Methylovulum sp.]
MPYLVCLLFSGVLLFSSLSQAKPLAPEQVPEPLKPWIAWVQEERPEQACPFMYNSYEQKRCSWPTETQLDLTPKKGQFSTRWQVYAESWVGLPGDGTHWPLNVTVNDKPALVLDRNGIPSIKLAADAKQPLNYQIKGEFLWDAIPDNLAVPADTGLIDLKINGLAIPAPMIRGGQIWLKESEVGLKKPENVQNSLDIQVFRKITDDVPVQVLTRLMIDVSGVQRELKLPRPLLAGFIPLSVQSALPARLEPDGQLLMQVRPGRWVIDIMARNTNELTALPFPTTPAENWPQTEIWVFEARPDLRVVEIGQVGALDTSQTNLPEDWKMLPAYSISQGETMGFKVIRRGDPEPEPNQLNLARKLWLDFDGTGYTVNDLMTGKMTRGWRLNALPQTHTGKVTLDGNNQLITHQPGTDKNGVEVRKGLITLDADSRIIGPIGTLSAVGWEQDFHQVSAELNLPPGWRLLAAAGVDNVPDSWISRWTLLDLFLVLIAGLATGRLWNKAWGAFALVTLTLIWHEPDSPHFVWLVILATTALINLVPPGRFLKFLTVCRTLSWLVLVLIAVPFMVDQVRTGLYPQLESHLQTAYPMSQAVSPMEMQMKEEAVSSPYSGSSLGKMRSYAYNAADKVAALPKKKAVLDRIDPSAHIQTGPGLPQWQWHKIMLSWNGAVDSQQQLRLWYLSPMMTLLLNFIRVLFIAALALLMFGVAEKFRPDFSKFKAATPLWLGVLLVPMLAMPTQKSYADYPNDALLAQLKSRLQEVEVPDCLPACAQIPQMAMTINEKTIDISLQIDAQESVTLPLPADYSQWFPNQVLDNGSPATALYRDNNGLWITLKAGGHRVILRGVAPLLSKLTLPLPLKPNYVTVEKTGWEVIGMQNDGQADGQLQFSRISQSHDDNTKNTLEPGALPAFARVERTVQLDLDWHVSTQVIRMSPPDTAVVLSVPLLPGEAVTSPGVRVKDGKVEVNIPAQQYAMQWESTLAKTDKISLTAPQTDQWIEVWKADVSPIWHIEASGIAMIHLNNTAQWLPEWHPWPSETIALQITRPVAVEGQTLTIDSSRLQVKPGQRITDAGLSFSLRSSQGGQHVLTLPENALLQSVTIDGQTRPIRQQGRKLTLPVNPGKQNIAVNWQEAVPLSMVFSTPQIDLGQASVNTDLTINLGQDRWVLFALGPRLGPAVLFWGILIVIFMLALGLGKVHLTPLKHWQWFLLLVGLSQIPIMSAGLVIAWLMVLGWRTQQTAESRYFNELQTLIAGMTLISLGILFFAVAQGLLSSPDMRITGNQSTAFNLNWYQDRSLSTLPTATLVSVPLLVYRLLMLAWSLWLAVSLLDWLKWGWGCFSSNGLWKKKIPVEKPVPMDVNPPKKDGEDPWV